MVKINPFANLEKSLSLNSMDKLQQSGDSSFTDMLANALKNTVQAQRTAENMSVKAAMGEDIPMQEVIQAVNKAEMTLQTMLTVRDRAVESYQEILRMPI